MHHNLWGGLLALFLACEFEVYPDLQKSVKTDVDTKPAACSSRFGGEGHDGTHTDGTRRGQKDLGPRSPIRRFLDRLASNQSVRGESRSRRGNHGAQKRRSGGLLHARSQQAQERDEAVPGLGPPRRKADHSRACPRAPADPESTQAKMPPD